MVQIVQVVGSLLILTAFTPSQRGALSQSSRIYLATLLSISLDPWYSPRAPSPSSSSASSCLKDVGRCFPPAVLARQSRRMALLATEVGRPHRDEHGPGIDPSGTVALQINSQHLADIARKWQPLDPPALAAHDNLELGVYFLRSSSSTKPDAKYSSGPVTGTRDAQINTTTSSLDNKETSVDQSERIIPTSNPGSPHPARSFRPQSA